MTARIAVVDASFRRSRLATELLVIIFDPARDVATDDDGADGVHDAVAARA